MQTDAPLFGWFERLQRESPQASAWISGERQLDYRTLYRQTQGLAARALQDGLQPGKPLAAVCAGQQQLGRAALLAMYLGCPLLPLKPQRESLRPLLKACAINQLVADGPADYDGIRRIALQVDAAEPARPECPPRPLAGDRVQLLIATSGSTGPARITRHSGDNLCAAVTASQLHTGLTHEDRWLNCLPLHHIGGLAILLRCLQAGATMLIEEGFDPVRILDDLRRHTISHLSLVPAMLARLLEVQGRARLPDSLRCVLVGGGPLSATLAQQALSRGWPLLVTWGMSETASHVTLCRPGPGWEAGMVGKPVQGCRLEIVDTRGQAVSGRGRIRISGPMLMQGYCNDADPLANGIVDGQFTSSDTGFLDADGALHLCGRADNQLVSGGYNIDPERVEAVLGQCRGIGEVAVTAIEDPAWGDLLLALFTGPATEQAVLQCCRSRLDSAVRPRHVLKTSRLPLTSLGKPDRPAIARLAAQLIARRTPRTSPGAPAAGQ